MFVYPASHAHTLLLDLEQLVVVANLDKIKLDSSSSSSYSSASCSTITTTNAIDSSLTSTSTYLSMIPKSSVTSTTNLMTSTTATSSAIDSSMTEFKMFHYNGDGGGDDHLLNKKNCSDAVADTNLTTATNHFNNINNCSVLDNANQLGLFDLYLDISKFKFASGLILV